MIYIASPYSANDADGDQRPEYYRKLRYEHAKDFVGYLLDSGMFPYSPIVSTHEIAKNNNLRTDAAFWMNFNDHMLSLSREMYVLCLHNWEHSVGVAHEIEVAKKLGLKITYWYEAEDAFGGYYHDSEHP